MGNDSRAVLVEATRVGERRLCLVLCGTFNYEDRDEPIDSQRADCYSGICISIFCQTDYNPKLTIYCVNKETEKTKKRTLPSGQVIEVPDGVEQKATYYVDSLTTAERDGKSRGALTMERKFTIPPVNAWDLFVEKYNTAIEQAKKQYGQL